MKRFKTLIQPPTGLSDTPFWHSVHAEDFEQACRTFNQLCSMWGASYSREALAEIPENEAIPIQ